MSKIFVKSLFILKSCIVALQELFSGSYTYRASALAYLTLLSIVPLLSVIMTISVAFPSFYKLIDLTQQYIQTNFFPTEANKIIKYLTIFVNQSIHLSHLGTMFLLISTIILLVTIHNTLNEIWNIKKKKTMIKYCMYWIVLLSLPFIIGLSIFVSGYIASIKWLYSNLLNVHLKFYFLTLFIFFINMFILTVFYTITPNIHLGWKNGFLGGFVAALCFELTKIAFSYYLKFFSSYEIIYGTFSIIPITLVWLYLLWLIVIYGALVTSTQYKRKKMLHKSVN